MKKLLKSSIRVIRQNYIPFIIFWILLFRPQILFWLRQDVIKPIHKKYSHSQTHSFQYVKPDPKPMPVVHAGFVRVTESDDGCGGDGSCSTDSDSEDNTEAADYSNDDGCNDDGSCESEDGSYSAEANDSYNDDGCSCAGETVVTSSGPDNSYYFNSTLQIKLNIGGTTSPHKLYIADSAGNILDTFFRNTSFGNGVYYYDWDGNYGSDRFVGEGYYKVVFETEGSPYERHEQFFYYSTVHGFQVNGGAGNVAEIYQ